MSQVILALFMIGFGLSVARLATHAYQALARQRAALRWDGGTVLAGMAHVAISFICGPYLMLRMALTPDADGSIEPVSVLLGSVIAFSWSFVTGLMLIGTYVALAIAA